MIHEHYAIVSEATQARYDKAHADSCEGLRNTTRLRNGAGPQAYVHMNKWRLVIERWSLQSHLCRHGHADCYWYPRRTPRTPSR